MLLEVHNGRVDLSGTPILTDINLSINNNSKIAVVGRNGSGKTTLLRLLAGELPLANEQSDGGFISISENAEIGSLNQMAFDDLSRTLLEEIRSAYSKILSVKEELDGAQSEMEASPTEENIKRYTALLDLFTNLGGFYFEKEYEAALKKFGFSSQEKQKPLCEFSGGERTKIAFLKLLLSKPDLLLLDEPTNHLDIEAVSWLEDYIKNYKKAVLIVSHDRMFLDNTVSEVYEIEHGKSEKYIGNYSAFTHQKRERRAQQKKDYEAQQKEIARITATAERFRYKATKAAMAQSKLKSIERMEKLTAPESFDNKSFRASLSPTVRSAKEVLSVSELAVGYATPLCTVNLELYRGERLGIIGGNGLGKSTLLKTLMGALPALSGEYRFGALVNIGYFDQQLAQIAGNETVFESLSREFPRLNDFEIRSRLGAFLFSQEDVFKRLDMLSGGERVRLALCKLFERNPNLLILDEPTNHMDIISKETLEDILEGFDGTLIFVSHDRYFVKKLATRLLIITKGEATVFDGGYEEYLAHLPKNEPASTPKPTAAKQTEKKTFVTPLKEKARRERALKKAEENIERLEAELSLIGAELSNPQNASDYQKLEELSEKSALLEAELLEAMTEWEALSEENI